MARLKLYPITGVGSGFRQKEISITHHCRPEFKTAVLLIVIAVSCLWLSGCKAGTENALEIQGRVIISLMRPGRSIEYGELVEDKPNEALKFISLAPEIDQGVHSPDLRHLVFVREDQTRLYDLGKREESPLFPFRCWDFSWSPDGRFLAFVRQENSTVRAFCVGDPSGSWRKIWDIPSQEYSGYRSDYTGKNQYEKRRVYYGIGPIRWLNKELITVDRYRGGFPQVLEFNEYLKPDETLLVAVDGIDPDVRELKDRMDLNGSWQSSPNTSWNLFCGRDTRFIMFDPNLDRIVTKPVDRPQNSPIPWFTKKGSAAVLQEDQDGILIIRLVNPDKAENKDGDTRIFRLGRRRKILGNRQLNNVQFVVSADERWLLLGFDLQWKKDPTILFEIESGRRKTFRTDWIKEEPQTMSFIDWRE